MLIGLELLFNSVKGDINCKEDALIVAIHCLLLQDGFKCYGTTEEEFKNNKGSELLPKEWNRDADVYTLYYGNSDGSLHVLLKAVKAGNELLLNLLNLDRNTSAALSVTVDSHISDNFTALDTAYLNLKELEDYFNDKGLKDIKNSSTQQPTASGLSQESQNLRPERDRDPSHPSVPILPERDRYYGESPFSVGSSDLDPLGYNRPGTGMLMDPRHPLFRPHFDPHSRIPARLPRGAVPPGARFDPYGPPGTGAFGSPNPDHLPPPGYEDMFM